MATPHNSAPVGSFAPTVLMPGDPLRAKFIAENFLTDAKLVNNVRGIQGYTGTYKGKKVSVMASGMGMPSVGIYAHELYRVYGVEAIIRVGTAGGINMGLQLRDLVAAMSAYTDFNFAKQYGFQGIMAPSCDFGLLEAAVKAGKKKGVHMMPGPVYSSSVFYDSSANESLQKLGVLAVEMESAALYTEAAAAGKKALSLLTISDHVFTGESLDAEARQNSFTDMMEIALEIAL